MIYDTVDEALEFDKPLFHVGDAEIVGCAEHHKCSILTAVKVVYQTTCHQDIVDLVG